RRDGLQLEVPAADRAERFVVADEHARADAARHRAAHGHDLDDDRGSRVAEPRGGAIAQSKFAHGADACTAVIARRIASLVAGAVRGGSMRWPPAADTASRIAKKIENGSSSRGSPVAL